MKTDSFTDIKNDGAVYVGQPKKDWLLGVYKCLDGLVDVTYDGRIAQLSGFELQDLLSRLNYLTEYVETVIDKEYK